MQVGIGGVSKQRSDGSVARDAFARAAERLFQCAASEYPDRVSIATQVLISTIERGNKILVFGNGGSASDALHICGELVVRFRTNRVALPAIALCADVATLTACANDFGYQMVFSRQIEAIGQEGDVVWGISTSGESPNVVEGLKTAQRMKLKSLLLTGPRFGSASKYSDVILNAPGITADEIQEIHQVTFHSICLAIEKHFCRAEPTTVVEK